MWVGIDAQLILDAARGSVQLWPRLDGLPTPDNREYSGMGITAGWGAEGSTVKALR